MGISLLFTYALLCTAIQKQHTEFAKLLLTNGSRVNSESNNPSETPLHFAVENGDIEIIQMLLDRDANVNAKNADGKTALHLATKRGYSRIVEHLLSHGAYVNACDNREGYTPLHLAARNGNKEIMQLLLSEHADVNAEAKDNVTSLHIALQEEECEIAKLLLKYGANVNAVYNTSGMEKGYTPLHLAAKRGNEEIIILLLSNGADVNAEAKDSVTSLHIALDCRYEKIAKHLLNCGANFKAVYNTSGWEKSYTPLHLAAENGYEEIIILLLSKGADVNAEAKDGVTSLHIALDYRHERIAKHLLNCGANFKAVYNTSGREEGYTPLHLAAENGYEEIIILLLSKGADVNAEAKDGKTSLHIAIYRGYEKIAEQLLNYGANVNAVYNKSGREEGYTPLHLAAENGSEVMIRLLLKFDANVDSTDENGLTALHVASKNDRKKIVTALLEHGSDATITSKQNYTALDFAMYPYEQFRNNHLNSNYGHVEVVKILKRHMIKIKLAYLYAVNKDILSISSATFGSDDEELSDYQNECEKEIASIKREVINDNSTLYDILTKSVRALARYATNESIVEAFRSDNYKTKFPIYASMIKRNFKKGEMEKEFMEKGDKIFGFLFSKNFPRLPPECIEKILSYLNYKDLI